MDKVRISSVQQTEADLRAIMDSADQLIVLMDLNKKVRFFNRYAENYYIQRSGIQLKVGLNFEEAVHPEWRTSFVKNFEKTLGGEVTKMLRRFENQDASVNWLELTYYPIILEGGEVSGVSLIGQDITARHQIEEDLKRSEARLQAIIDGAPLEIYVKDAAGRFMLFNRNSRRLMSLGRERVIGHLESELFPREMMDTWKGYDHQVLEQGSSVEYEEIEEFPDEQRVNITSKFPLLDERGRPYAVVGMSLNITERKKAEAALAAEKEQLAVTLQSIAEGVITTNEQGRVQLLNPAAQVMTGWSDAEANGQKLEQVFVTFEEVRPGSSLESDAEVAQTGLYERICSAEQVVEFTNRQTKLRSRDGTERYISGSGAPLMHPQGTNAGVALIFHDVTDKHRLSEERSRASKLEALGVLAGGLAHDFNNLLTVIMGNISLAGMMLDTKPDKVRERLEQAEQGCRKATELTQQLLTFARGGSPVKRLSSLPDLIRESADFVSHGAAAQVKYDLPDELWPVEADRSQLSQVIQNLVINAHQVMPGGGRIDLAARNRRLSDGLDRILPPGSYVELTVRDQGPGIPPALLDKIFDPYFTTKENGSGLGLAVCYSVLKQHGGYIDVRSEVSQGAEFRLLLPAKPGGLWSVLPENYAERVGDNLAIATPAALRQRVLVMDDESTIRDLLKVSLEQLGYEVATADEGQGAIDLYLAAAVAGQPFACVIMDLTIPGGMGGKETIQRLRELDPQVRAIVSSGYATDPVMANYKSYGFAGLVNKPYRITELAEMVKMVIDGKPPKEI